MAKTVTLFYDLSPDGKEVVFQGDSTVKTISTKWRGTERVDSWVSTVL